jgi:hypothetical protein
MKTCDLKKTIIAAAAAAAFIENVYLKGCANLSKYFFQPYFLQL